MKTDRIVLVSTLIMALVLSNSSNLYALEHKKQEKDRLVIGHFTISMPGSWKSLVGSSRDAVRAEFVSSVEPGLGRYRREGHPPPRMGQFEIYQKPAEGQLIAWTLIIPAQTDFLKEILKIEDTDFQSKKDLAGGQIKTGTCRLVKIGAKDVVRVDVEMANGSKATNIHFWSPKSPGVITTLMIGLLPNRSAQTEEEFNSIISSIMVSDDVKK